MDRVFQTRNDWRFLLLFLSVPWLMNCSSVDVGSEPVPTDQAKTTRIYVGNSGSTTVSVIDHDSWEVVETIELAAVHHGSAPSNKGDRIYLTTKSGEVIAIDTLSNEILWRAQAGSSLHEPSITHDDRFVYAPEYEGGRLVIIDTQSGKLVEEIKMVDPETGEKIDGLHNLYEMADGLHLLCTSIQDEAIAKVNLETGEIVRIYRVNGQPRPAAIMRDMSTAFVQLSEFNGFIAIDLKTGEEIKRIEWPFDGELPEGVATWTPSHGISLTTDNQEVWAASSFTSQLYVYSVPQLEKLAVVNIGVLPNWIALSHDGKILYVTSQEPTKEQGTVFVIDISSRTILKTIKVGPKPKRIHLVDLPS